jgi:hypothetical protein
MRKGAPPVRPDGSLILLDQCDSPIRKLIVADPTPRPDELPAWDSLSPAQKRLLARQMEVYAGLIAHTDHEIGRLLDAIRAAGHAENTLIVYIADDNGPTAEGGHDGRDALTAEATPQSLEERWSQYDALGSEAFDNAPAAAWAWAVNSPFQGAKQDASHLGGTTGLRGAAERQANRRGQGEPALGQSGVRFRTGYQRQPGSMNCPPRPVPIRALPPCSRFSHTASFRRCSLTRSGRRSPPVEPT